MRLIPDKMEIVEGSTKRVALNLNPLIGASTITSVAFACDGITIASPTHSAGVASCLVSGGDGGSNYILKLTAVLSNGETEVGSILLKWKSPGSVADGGL